MMAGPSLELLRSEFDGSFALPLKESAPDLIDLLAIRVAGRPYALRVAEIGGVAAGRRVTSVPSPRPALAGLVSVRGALVAVFDLAALLGMPASAGGSARWVALCGEDAGLALAFDEFEGHLRLPAAALRAHESKGAGFVEHVVGGEAELRPIASIPRIVESVSRRTGRERPGKAT